MASNRRCDLLVGDIQFPDGSGLDLMRELRARYGLRGIAITGYTATQDVQAMLRAGFVRYLAKPITFPDLLAAVEELTGNSETEAGDGAGPVGEDECPFVPAG